MKHHILVISLGILFVLGLSQIVDLTFTPEKARIELEKLGIKKPQIKGYSFKCQNKLLKTSTYFIDDKGKKASLCCLQTGKCYIKY